MENSKIFKKLVIVMLSLVLVAVCSTNVFAADDDLFLSVNSTGTNATDNNTAVDDNNTTNNVTANNTTNNTTNSSLTANNTTRNTATNNTANSNSNRNVSNTLAKTGLSNNGGIIALVLVVFGLSAIYSYKKVNDYKKL